MNSAIPVFFMDEIHFVAAESRTCKTSPLAAVTLVVADKRQRHDSQRGEAASKL